MCPCPAAPIIMARSAGTRASPRHLPGASGWESLPHQPLKAKGLWLGLLGAQLLWQTRVCSGPRGWVVLMPRVAWNRVYFLRAARPPPPASCTGMVSKTIILLKVNSLSKQHILTRALCCDTDSKVLKAQLGPQAAETGTHAASPSPLSHGGP